MYTVGLPHSWTPNCRSKNSISFIEKNPYISGLVQFKLMLYKGQLNMLQLNEFILGMLDWLNF